MPVYLENMSSGPSICSPTHLYKTLRVYPPPLPHSLSPFPRTFLLLATMQRTEKDVDAARVQYCWQSAILNVTFNWFLIAFVAALEVWLVATFSVVSTSDVLD